MSDYREHIERVNSYIGEKYGKMVTVLKPSNGFEYGLRGCRIERLMKEKKIEKKGNKSDNSREFI